MPKWNYERRTRNIYRLPHHLGLAVLPEVAPSHLLSMHNVIDFRLPIGTAVFAALDGIVEVAIDHFEDNGRTEHEFFRKCNYLILKHPYNEYSVYAHLQQGSIAARVGEHVRKNQQIGVVGLSGFTSYPHLHFEVYKKNEEFGDPTLLVQFEFRKRIFTMRSPN